MAATTAQAGGVQVRYYMTHTMQEIATSSQKIGDIISVIDGIAFQTNILAPECGSGSGSRRRAGAWFCGSGR